jgi:hypothetical protein
MGPLLAGIIDYAGLFPPAELELPAALANYRSYQGSPDAWALGRFVLPAARLMELAALLRRDCRLPEPLAGQGLPLSVVFGAATAEAMTAVEGFEREAEGAGARIEAVEAKAGSESAARTLLASIAPRWKRYLEVSLGDGSEAVLDAIAAGGGFAKLRMGGTTADAFPDPDEVIRYLEGAAARKLPFKATAGLHHALRDRHRLTYAVDSPSGVMYGFLNLLLAAAILWTGGTPATAREALLETDPRAVRVAGSALSWKQVCLDGAAARALRSDFVHSIGSCSFREPLDELAAGGWG